MLEKCEGTLQGVWPWRRTAGVEPGAVKVARRVLNGGDEETCGNATRLVPIQLRRCGFQRRLKRGVRPQAIKAPSMPKYTSCAIICTYFWVCSCLALVPNSTAKRSSSCQA